MNELKVYAAFRAAGMTAEGACGMMGNIRCESVGHANNLQDSYNNKIKLSDEQYTALVDAGKPTYNGKYFANDEAGYGLCQWTHPDRKKKLLAFAKAECASIGDEDMQVRYAIHELKTDFPAVWWFLCNTGNVYEASAMVCKRYEMPAVNNVDARAAAAENYYSRYSTADYNSVEVETESPISAPSASEDGESVLVISTETMMHLQVILTSLGYKIGTQAAPNGVDGLNGKKSASALKDLADKLLAML